MGTSQAGKAETHDRIVRIAAARFREAGLDGISVADIMKEAGLTHGGFYRHFASRDELVAEAVDYAMAQGARRLARAMTRSAKAPFDALVESYLSKAHRDADGATCPLAALANDVARSDTRVRTAYARQVREYLTWIAGIADAQDEPTGRREAVATLSALVGALALARAVDDDALSSEILKATAEHLKEAKR